MLAALALLLAACTQSGAPDGDDWPDYDGPTSTHYSPLSEIDDGNVARLGLAWSYATGTTRGLQATPIIVDGRMYATGVWSVVYALDAKTGKELWTYDPQVPREWGRYACCDAVNRGVALYQGKVGDKAAGCALFPGKQVAGPGWCSAWAKRA